MNSHEKEQNYKKIVIEKIGENEKYFYTHRNNQFIKTPIGPLKNKDG